MSLPSAFRRLCANWPELGAFAGELVESLSPLEPDAVRGRIEELRDLSREDAGAEGALLAKQVELFDALHRGGRWRANPDVLGDWSALLLRAGVSAEEGSPEAEQLAQWLRSLPRALRNALAERERPDARALELALETCRAFRGQIDALAHLVPTAALQAALLALAEHEARLKSLAPGVPLEPLGDGLDALLALRGLPTSSELVSLADAEIARLREALRSPPPPDETDGIEFTPDVMRDALRTELEVVAGVWRLAKLPSAPQRFEVVPTPEGLEGAIPHAAVFTPRPLRPSEPALAVLNPRSTITRDTGRRLMLAVHEGAPGHGLQAARANAANRPWRAVDLCPIPGLGAGLFAGELMEGWPHFAEARYAEIFPDDARLQHAVRREALWRAARARADLGHARGELDERAAAALLAEVAGLSHDDALAEVDDFRLNPTYGLSYFAGKHQLRELRARCAGTEGELYTKLLDEGLSPISLSVKSIGI